MIFSVEHWALLLVLTVELSAMSNYVRRNIPVLTVLTVKWAVKNTAKSHKNAEHNVQNYETHSYPIVDTTKNMKV